MEMGGLSLCVCRVWVFTSEGAGLKAGLGFLDLKVHFYDEA